MYGLQNVRNPLEEMILYIGSNEGSGKYIKAKKESLQYKYEFYSSDMMELNKKIQRRQYEMLKKRCSYGLDIKYVEFCFTHKKHGDIYIGVNINTARYYFIPSKEFYLNRGFEESDLYTEQYIPSPSTIMSPENKKKEETKFNVRNNIVKIYNDSQIIQNSISLKAMKSQTETKNWTDSTLNLYDGKAYKNAGATKGKLSDFTQECFEKSETERNVKTIINFIQETIEKLAQKDFDIDDTDVDNLKTEEFIRNYDELEINGENNSDKNAENKISMIKKWLQDTKEIFNHKHPLSTTSVETPIDMSVNNRLNFGTFIKVSDYEIPEFTQIAAASYLNKMFDFYSGNSQKTQNVFSYKGRIPLPIQDTFHNYSHYSDIYTMDVNNIERLCDFWNFPSNLLLSSDLSSDEEEKLRFEFKLLNEEREKKWNTCETIKSKIEELKEKDDEVESVTRIIEIISKFNRNISGDARLDIKVNVANIIITFLRSPSFFHNKYLNFSLTGGAGTGKTTIAQNLGTLLKELGILVTDNFDQHSRSTLVGQYVGETANITRTKLVSSLEGVFFLDEAYALTQSSKGGASDENSFDQYGIESINEFINFMDKNRGKIVIITAGYEKEINKFWFGPNEGMRRRMPYNWKLQNYSALDLLRIMNKFYQDEQKDIQELLPKNMKDIFNIDSGSHEVLFINLLKSCDIYYDHTNDIKNLRYDILEKYQNSYNEFEKQKILYQNFEKEREKNEGSVYAKLKNQAGDIENIMTSFTAPYINSKKLFGGSEITQTFENIFYKTPMSKFVLIKSYFLGDRKRIDYMYVEFLRILGIQPVNGVGNLSFIDPVFEMYKENERRLKEKTTKTRRRKQPVNLDDSFSSNNSSDDDTGTYDNNNGNNIFESNSDDSTDIAKNTFLISDDDVETEDLSEALKRSNSNNFGRRKNKIIRMIKKNKHVLSQNPKLRNYLAREYLKHTHNTNHI